MKYFLLGIAVCLSGLSAAADSALPDNAYLPGVVSYILEDYSGAETPQRLVKVRLHNQKKDFVMIDMPAGQKLKIGDKVLLQKAADNYNYGLDTAFEEKFLFADFARGGSVVVLLILLLLGFTLVNRRNWPQALFIIGNIFLLCLVLPFWLAQRWPLFGFTALFCLASALPAARLLSSRKLWPALVSALLGSSAAGGLYAWLIHRYHLTPFIFPQKDPGLTFAFPQYLDAALLLMLSFYLCLFTVVFLLKTSYRVSIIENIRLFFFRTLQLFGLIGGGLLLPFLLYFQLNNIELAYLLNYPPFVYLFNKLVLCLLAIQASCLFYLFYYYNKHKKYFHQPAAPENQSAAENSKPLELQKILQNHTPVLPKNSRRRNKARAKKNKHR
ncbi:MAG: hypothetical protein LBJ25_07160 [Candidatus Margulisbacteria bacterium]|jgi:hypothetical protein|nr:hypothetical protein [Candidatus Margulisiibacteriota bacterium]